MSLPPSDVQGSRFESLSSIAAHLFCDQDRYKRFAMQGWPRLATGRAELKACHVLDNGQPGIGPAVLGAVRLLQFLEPVPEQQGVRLGMFRSSEAQSTAAAPPSTITPGVNASFALLEQIDGGVLMVGYAEVGPTDGPVTPLLHVGP